MVQKVTADYWSANKSRFCFSFFETCIDFGFLVKGVSAALLEADLWSDLVCCHKNLYMGSSEASRFFD